MLLNCSILLVHAALCSSSIRVLLVICFVLCLLHQILLLALILKNWANWDEAAGWAPADLPPPSQPYLLQTQYNFSQSRLAVINFIFSSVFQSWAAMNTSIYIYIYIYIYRFISKTRISRLLRNSLVSLSLIMLGQMTMTVFITWNITKNGATYITTTYLSLYL